MGITFSYGAGQQSSFLKHVPFLMRAVDHGLPHKMLKFAALLHRIQGLCAEPLNSGSG